MTQGIFNIVFLVIVLSFRAEVSYGQCYPDRHSTNWYDGWVSCEAFPNPNPNHGISHWIMYDFGQVHALKKTKIWNTNDPNHLDRGLKDISIDVSENGTEWISAGTYTLSPADGKNTYQGSEGPDLSGINARYVLITAIENWGGACYGLSEVRFEVEDAVTGLEEHNASSQKCFEIEAYPNPFTVKSRIIIRSQCDTEINYRITDILGRAVGSGVVGGASGFHSIQLDGSNMVPGNYLVNVSQSGQFEQQHLVKIE